MKKEATGYKKDLGAWKKKAEAAPKEVIKYIEVIKEVPVEIIKEVEVVKSFDFEMLEKMMQGMETVEVSKTVVGETRTEGEATIVDRREVTESTRSKVSKKKGKAKKDDLKKIEGIGPKIASLLNNAGIHTFRELSKTKAKGIKAILEKAGKRYQMHDPTTWPKQAEMAADGKWDELKKWQDELDGGK